MIRRPPRSTLFPSPTLFRSALLQLVRDVRQAAPRPATAPAPPAAPAAVPPVLAVAVLVIRLVRLVFVFRLDQVGGVEEGALFRPAVDERRLNPRQHRLHRAEVDVT